MKTPNKQYVGLLYLLFLFVFIFILNRLMPLYSDDWVYSFVYKTNHRIESIGDIFYSQYRHYFLWGGRTVAHIIAQTLLFINKDISDCLNALVYILLIYCVYGISRNSFKLNNITLLFIISSSLVLFLPYFIETVLFKTVSCNYMWTTVIILLYLLPFVANVYKSGDQKAIPVVMFFCGIIAGWTNENTGFALVVGAIMFIYLYKKEYKKIPSWAVWGLIGIVIGFSIMVLAPGNGLRENKGYLNNPNFSYCIFYLMRLKYTMKIYMLYGFPLTLVYFLFFIIYKLSDVVKNKNVINVSIIFFIMAQISMFIMIAAPVFPNRTAFSAVVFLIVAISTLYSNLLFEGTSVKKIFFIFSVFLLFASFYKYIVIYEETYSLNNIVKKRDLFIESNIKENNYNILLPPENMYFENFTYPDAAEDSTFWLNRDYAKYKKVKTIRVGISN